MNNLKYYAVITIFSAFFFCVTIGLILSISGIDKLTDKKTTEFTATVVDIKITNTGKDVFVEINTKEYDTLLFISENVCNNIENDRLRGIKEGDTIFFGIENTKKKQINLVDFIDIVSLRTDTDNIFSLKEYNEVMHHSSLLARISSIIFALLFLFLFLHFFYKLKHKKEI